MRYFRKSLYDIKSEEHFVAHEDDLKEKGEFRDKGKYSSAITFEYFKYWNDLELESVGDIKSKIRDNICMTERKNDLLYEKYAKKHGMSCEEYKESLQDYISRIANNMEFFRATTEKSLKRILEKKGEWKTQFETENGGGGMFDQILRAKIEKNMFDFPEDKNDNTGKRPVYGYFTVNGSFPKDILDHYGGVQCKFFKKSMLQYSTITFQDTVVEQSFPPTPASMPHFTSILINDKFDPLEFLEKLENDNKQLKCTEAQYHKHPNYSDIEAIYVKYNEADDIYKRIKDIVDNYNIENPFSAIEFKKIKGY
ncbi:MAG: hypothetical protein V1770_03015 [bacterium]